MRLARMSIVLVLLAVAAVAAQTERPTGTHVVRPGETLRIITAYYLGSDTAWQENWKLNPEITDPHKLLPGQRIRVLIDRQQPRQTASIDKVARRVQSKPDPVAWLAALQGDVLRVRDAVRTFNGSSAELLFDDGVRLQVTEDSLVFLRAMGQSVRGDRQKSLEIGAGQADLAAAGTTNASDIELLVGTTVARPRPSSDGSRARLRKTTEGGSQIMVYVGDSQIAANGTTVTVPRGMGTSVPSQGPPGPPQPLLPAPSLGLPVLDARSEYANPQFTWQPVTGASRYVVEVCNDAACGALVARTRVTTANWTPAALPVGGFFWRITAVAASGLDGYPSEPRAITIASDRVTAAINGVVLEDVVGTGTFAGAVARANVAVHLYDGARDVTDRAAEPRASTRTDQDGRFTFNAGGPADYWVAVDTTSIAPAAGFNAGANTTWVIADQTAGPAGALCATPASATAPLKAEGTCFGGRVEIPRDNPRTLGGSRSVARVRATPSKSVELRFAYSFRTVSVPTDIERGTPRQGSIRQFMINADAITGPDAMRFVPAIAATSSGSGTPWWTATLAEDLPPLTDRGTTIDGRIAGARTVATGGVTVLVGVEGHALKRPARPALEIDGRNFGGLAITGTDAIVRDLAIHSAAASPVLAGGDKAPPGLIVAHGTATVTIDNVTAGSRPDGSRLAEDRRQSDVGIGVFDRARVVATSSLVRDQRMYGILVQSGTSDARIDATDVEVASSGFGSRLGDGLALHSDGSQLRFLYVHDNTNSGEPAYDGGAGLELWADNSQYGRSASNNTIESSTFEANGRGITLSTNAMDNVVRGSIIAGNKQSGVLINMYTRAFIPVRNRITGNVLRGNGGAPIVLDGSLNTTSRDPEPAANDGRRSEGQPHDSLDAPVIESASLAAGRLTVRGYVGSEAGQDAFAGVTVEFVDADSGAVLGQATADATGRFEGALPPKQSATRIRALAIDARGNTSPFGPATAVGQ